MMCMAVQYMVYIVASVSEAEDMYLDSLITYIERKNYDNKSHRVRYGVMTRDTFYFYIPYNTYELPLRALFISRNIVTIALPIGRVGIR